MKIFNEQEYVRQNPYISQILCRGILHCEELNALFSDKPQWVISSFNKMGVSWSDVNAWSRIPTDKGISAEEFVSNIKLSEREIRSIETKYALENFVDAIGEVFKINKALDFLSKYAR